MARADLVDDGRPTLRHLPEPLHTRARMRKEAYELSEDEVLLRIADELLRIRDLRLGADCEPRVVVVADRLGQSAINRDRRPPGVSNQLIGDGDDAVDLVFAGLPKIVLQLLRLDRFSSDLALDQSRPDVAARVDDDQAVRPEFWVRLEDDLREALDLRPLADRSPEPSKQRVGERVDDTERCEENRGRAAFPR